MKIMVWNIERFTESRLDHFTEYRSGALTYKRRRIYHDRQNVRDYMQQVFTGNSVAAWVPHVAAILEVQAPWYQGLGAALADDSPGANGLIRLLDLIKTWTGNDNWRLVPPLKSNPELVIGQRGAAHEAIGVFYDKDEVRFTGPYRWIGGQSQPATSGIAARYPAPWRDVATTDNTRRAGIARYFTAAGVEITFPNNCHRRPFTVDFTERDGFQRDIRCCFLHTSPGYAYNGTRALGVTRELRDDAVGGPDLTVIAGDFNINDYQARICRQAFRPLTRRNFRQMFTRQNVDSTHYQVRAKATPYTRGRRDRRGNKGLYDGPWGYLERKVIDNFLIRNRNGALPVPAAVRRAAMDAVYGYPDPPYAKTMNIAWDDYQIYTNAVAAFRWWENFYHIRHTSDHTPTFLEI